ncbi:MAG: GTP-binding protein [Gammaproteobacteria bacterium]|nr:GTP-binding protein [Gammaproteobacteria bacterium]
MEAVARKICIIGDFAVGKTSTVARFVHNAFSEKYLTTVGVKIDTREIDTNSGPVKLVIWDIAGTDRFSAIEFSYLRGAAGYLVVADGTRGHTVDVARRLRAEARERYGEVPSVMLVNKADLADEWDTDEATFDSLAQDHAAVFRTSAKTGDNVENAIRTLAEMVAG